MWVSCHSFTVNIKNQHDSLTSTHKDYSPQQELPPLINSFYVIFASAYLYNQLISG